MKNILTFDLEDWYHGNFLEDGPSHGMVPGEDRVVEPTRRILDMLTETGSTATFFVLGEVAAKFPELIREIDARGHEIASHCYEHRLVYLRAREDFARDLQKSVAVLEEIIDKPVIGFRAPYWSIYRENHWVWDILETHGIKYDSSLYPFRTYLYGDNTFPRFRYKIVTAARYTLEEIPPTTLELFGKRIPFCGGFYFRVLPYRFVRWAIRRVNRVEKQPVVFYLHPYEIDKNKPRSSRGFRNNFILHTNVRRAEAKLRRLLNDFDFVAMRDYYDFEDQGVVDSTSP